MATISVISNSTNTAPLTRPQIQDPVRNRVKRAFARAVLALIYIVLFPVTIAALGCRFYSYLSTKQLIEELAEKRYQAIQETVAEISLPDQCEVEGLGEAVQELKDFISSGKGHDHLQELRDKIDNVLRLPCYELNKEKRNPHLDFLHLLAHTLTAQAEGMEVLEKYGNITDDPPSYEKLASSLDAAVKKHHIFKKDNKLHKAFWIFAHPEKGFNSLFDSLGWTDPLSYNSYRQGNANIRIGAFRVGGMKMHFSLGPTLTADRLFEAHLQHLKNQGQLHLQHDLEFAGEHAEAKRRLEKQRIADQSSSSMLYMSTPLDGAIWKGRGVFGKTKSTAMFFDELKKYLTEENSFHLPKNLFRDEEVADLLKVTEAMFDNSPPNNRAQLLAFETCLAVHAILKSTDGKQGDAFFGQACKQDIDRGVIINVMTILYFDALGGVKLTKERMHQIVGIVLGRPEMVDDRSILTNRYKALSDLLHFIGKDPEKFFAPMKAHFGVTDVSFETVNVE